MYRLFAWLGGTSVITFVVRAAFRQVEQAPLGWQVFLIVGIALLWLAVVGYFAPLIPRWRPQWLGSHTQVRKATCPDEWIHSVVEADRQDLSRAICIDSCSADYEYLTSPPYRIAFHFRIFNGSMFTISADSLEGRIVFQGQPLNRPPELVEAFKNIPRGKRGGLHIHQYLHPEEATRISERISYLRSSGRREYFYLENVKVRIMAADEVTKEKKHLFALIKVPFPYGL